MIKTILYQLSKLVNKPHVDDSWKKPRPRVRTIQPEERVSFDEVFNHVAKQLKH